MIPPTTVRTTCRVCNSKDLINLFSLGEQYVSDFVTKEDIHSGIKAPIDLQLCRNCTLVQLKHTAPQEILYARHYWYRSGVTDTMKAALRNVTEAAESLVNLKEGDIVLDIGSNDGTLLRSYTKPVHRIGVEPAENLMHEGSKGIDCFILDFWNYPAYYAAAGKCAKVITACGMFYDLEDPNQFIADVAKALAPDGVFIAQLMCLRNMINVGDVGNFAHEHLEFYSLRSLEVLLGQHGLEIVNIETNEVNGESYRLFIYHKGIRSPAQKRIVRDLLKEEAELNKPGFYHDFFNVMDHNKKLCVDFVKECKAQGKTVWVYGASTKGNVILQYYGLDHTLIDGAADRSPEKHGLYTIGSGIKIHPEDDGRCQADYFLVLPYAFLPEFVKREVDWQSRGGQWIVPLPSFRVF